jgi:hypothetical protein
MNLLLARRFAASLAALGILIFVALALVGSEKRAVTNTGYACIARP